MGKINQINKKTRNWCITSFSKQTAEEFSKIFYDNTNKIRYMVYQNEEATETKNNHYQVYVELHSPQRMSCLKKIFDDNTIHCECKLGTREQARFYCMKNYDGIYNDEYKWVQPLHRGRKWGDKYYEFGSWIKGQGSREDIKKATKELIEGDGLDDVAINNPVVFVKYHRGLREYQNVLLKKTTRNFRAVSVSVYYGEAGTGKSKKALYDDEGNRKDDIYVLEQGANAVWFDGYSGEKTLVINDFYGWIKYGMMLNILDGHQQRLEVKGGFTWANWNKVIITSNEHPKNWYEKGFTNALKRRLNEIQNFTINDTFSQNEKFDLDTSDDEEIIDEFRNHKNLGRSPFWDEVVR